MLGLRCCARSFSSCSKLGLLFIALLGFLTAAASAAGDHRITGFSSCDTRASVLLMWNLPGPGIEPVPSTLADGVLSIMPQRSPNIFYLLIEVKSKSSLITQCMHKGQREGPTFEIELLFGDFIVREGSLSNI